MAQMGQQSTRNVAMMNIHHQMANRPQINAMNKADIKRHNGMEYCSKHHEANVGFVDREIVCNTCIFEKKLMAVKFTALVSKELRT